MTHLDRHAQSTSYCAACPKLCAFACPVSGATRRETVTPWAKMSLAEQLRQKRLPYTAETLDPLTHCLSCRLCTTYCKHEIDVGEALAAARADAFEAGQKEPALAALAETFTRYGAPTDVDLGQKLRATLDAELFAPEAQVVLFPGCRAITDAPQELQAAFRLLNALRIDFVAAYSGPDFCCGAPLYYAGYQAHFKRHAEKLGRRLQDFKQIIVPCSECAYFLKAVYLEAGIPIANRVKTLAEFLEPYLVRLTPHFLHEGKTALHLAPHDARYLSQGPRLGRLAQAALGQPPIPLVWRDQSSYACGSTGVLRFVRPEIAQAVSGEVLRQAREVGATTLLTSSPGSGILLKRAQYDTPGTPEVLSLIELLARAYAPEA